jgi:hypothetical protein
MKNKNDLNELNDILFENLRKLNNKEIDVKQATALVNVSNSIIDNAKTQLAAYKLTSDRSVLGAISPAQTDTRPYLKSANLVIPKHKKISKPSTFDSHTDYDKKQVFSESKGFKNVAEAVVSMGKNNFLDEFSKFVEVNGEVVNGEALQ